MITISEKAQENIEKFIGAKVENIKFGMYVIKIYYHSPEDNLYCWRQMNYDRFQRIITGKIFANYECV